MLKRALLGPVVVAVGVYAVLCVYLYSVQTQFIFFPSRVIEFTPAVGGCSYEDVTLPVPGEGQELHGWWLAAPADAKPPFVGKTLVYFHGNGGNVGANAGHTCRLNRLGFAVFIFDYRGYGQSSAPPGGKIHERTLYEDGEAALHYVKSKRGAEKVVLYGHSLGGAVAIEMAKRHPESAALITEAAFTSLLDMANNDPVFRLFPVGLILDQKMENEAKLREVRTPVLVIHGKADDLIPPKMAERLHAAAGGPKRLYLVADAGHDDVAPTAGAEYGRQVAALLEMVK